MTEAEKGYLWGMKQIDLEPSGYRKQDRHGRWVENVDRKLCQWLAVGSSAFMVFFAWHYRAEAPFPAMLFMLGMGAAIGALIVLSLKPTDR